MGRPAGVNGADTMRAIRKAAIQRIYRHGFEAMNLRDLAADVGLRVGSLYNHVPQKQEFLGTLIEGIMLELLLDLKTRMAGPGDPAERLDRFVRFHIEWHIARKEETFIGNTELRSLSPAQYQRVVALRKEYETHLRGILADGQKAGLWKLDDLRVGTLAMLSLLIDVHNWYRPDGRLSEARVVRIYQRLARRLLGLPPDGPPHAAKAAPAEVKRRTRKD